MFTLLCKATHKIVLGVLWNFAFSGCKKPSGNIEWDPKSHFTQGETQMTKKNKNRCSNQLVHVQA